MGIRGNGLGLSWDSTTDMRSEGDNVWSVDIQYYSGQEGEKGIFDDEYTIDTADYFKFRFYHDNTEMLGTDLKIRMPLSMVSNYYEGENPVFTYYPWFFSESGSSTAMDVDAGNDVVGVRNVVAYLPPSAAENPKPVYDVVYVIDLSDLNKEASLEPIENLFLTEASEAVVIGLGDWRIRIPGGIQIDRANMLCPTPGQELFCNDGNYVNNCNGCVPENYSEEEFYFWMTEGGCGHEEPCGGNADDFIDFMIGEAYDAANQWVREETGSVLTEDGQRTTLMGYSFGGLFACYASWSRPDVFGRASCQSPSLWWPRSQSPDPDDYNYYGEYYFLNETLYTNLDDRPKQYILLDAGELEAGPYTHMTLAARNAFEYIKELPGFEENVNVWHHVYPGLSHNGTPNPWTLRLWSAFKLLSVDRYY